MLYNYNVIDVMPKDELLTKTYVSVIVPRNYKQIIKQLKDSFMWFEQNEIYNEEFSNLTCVHTPFDSHLYTDLLVSPLNAIKEYVINHWIQTTGFKDIKDRKYFKVMDCWIANYGPGTEAKLHRHIPQDVVTTFYYDVEDATPLQFLTYDLDSGQEVMKTITPTEGMLVIFHGNTFHGVPRCRGNRKVFASNWYFDRTEYLDDSKHNRSFYSRGEKNS